MKNRVVYKQCICVIFHAFHARCLSSHASQCRNVTLKFLTKNGVYNRFALKNNMGLQETSKFAAITPYGIKENTVFYRSFLKGEEAQQCLVLCM